MSDSLFPLPEEGFLFHESLVNLKYSDLDETKVHDDASAQKTQVVELGKSSKTLTSSDSKLTAGGDAKEVCSVFNLLVLIDRRITTATWHTTTLALLTWIQKNFTNAPSSNGPKN